MRPPHFLWCSHRAAALKLTLPPTGMRARERFLPEHHMVPQWRNAVRFVHALANSQGSGIRDRDMRLRGCACSGA
jgi:hypothetical protein